MILWNQIIIMVLIVVSLDMKALGQRCQQPSDRQIEFDYFISDTLYQGRIQFYMSRDVFRTDVYAESECKKLCANLVVVDSREKMNALIAFVNNLVVVTALIAGNDKKVASTWVIGNGTTPIPYLRWGQNQPNGCRAGPPGHHCLFLNEGYNGMLDLGCVDGYWPASYICEKYL